MESRVADSRADAHTSGHDRAWRSLRRPEGRWLVWLGLFALVAATVAAGWWSRIDVYLNNQVASHRVVSLENAAKVVFDVATPEITLPITLALGVLTAWRRHRWGLAGEAVVRIGLVVASVLLLKPLIAAPGPTRNPLGDHGGAFPSGHTTSTLVCVALLSAWLGRPRSTAGRVAINATAVAIVGGSVICLSYHYVSDLVGGILLGLFIATVPLPGLQRHPEAD